MKLITTCQHCLKQCEEDNLHVEINFADGSIYFACPNCKKMNKMEVVKNPPPLPRMRRI